MEAGKAFRRGRYAAAVAAGLLLAAAFPNGNVAGFAWVAPGLILFVAIGTKGREAFKIGYVAGLAHYLASLYWLLLIPVPWVWAWSKALGWMALAAYLALYPATWVWLCWKMFPVQWDNSLAFRRRVEEFLKAGWSGRLVWALSGAALWVALEMVVTRLLGGFPWNLLGDSQYRIVPLIQIASVTGVYGVSFLLVWFAMSLMSAMAVMLQGQKYRAMLFADIVAPLLAAAVAFATGYHKVLQPGPKERVVTLALVQPSIPQTVKWDEDENKKRFGELIALSEQALSNRPDILVWPEAAVPGMVKYDEDIYKAVTGLAKSNRVWMIIGSDDFVPNPGAKTFKDGEFFNSSFLVSPEGRLAASYKKRNLVIFGEYVPLVKWLPFLKFLTPIGPNGFSAGKEAVSFNLGDLGVKASVLICYEDTFPQTARESVWDDTDFLVNLTNDGWFGEGAAQWQHAAAAIFRAVENGVPLVRCTNTGLTCWVDAEGRLRQIFRSKHDGIYGPGYMIAFVTIPERGEKPPMTFYRLHGDWFGWGCVGWVGIRLALVFLRNRRTKAPSTNLQAPEKH